MASLKYRVDREEATQQGQILGFAEHDDHFSLSRVKGAVCSDGVTRIAYVTGKTIDYWSLPARVNVGQRSVKGQLYFCEDEGLWKFKVWDN
jgi:hypothetical protein